jgi:hypothetical protein
MLSFREIKRDYEGEKQGVARLVNSKLSTQDSALALCGRGGYTVVGEKGSSEEGTHLWRPWEAAGAV